MATPPTFSVGATLTAAQMNAVGLWLVKSQTIGSGVSSVTVSNAFSSDYENYRIVVSGVTSTSGYSMYGSINAGTGSTYANGGRYISWGGVSADATSAGEAGYWFGVMGSNYCLSLDIDRPYLATPTNVAWSSSSSTYGNYGTGINSVSASSTNFTLYPGIGTLTGGTIRVYGYRN